MRASVKGAYLMKRERMNEVKPLKSIRLLLDESEEIVLVKALWLLAKMRDSMPDSIEKRIESGTQVSLLIKLQEQLYEKKA
jgi:hypothetical protein